MQPDEINHSIPSIDSAPTEKMVFMQEQMVSFLNQYSLPLLESSLVISKYTRQLSDALRKHAETENESLPKILNQPWPVIGAETNEQSTEYDISKLMENIDEDRMDIFDTILRTAIHTTEMPLADALMQLRQWEHLARSQLAEVKSPGQLFSPLEIPDEW